MRGHATDPAGTASLENDIDSCSSDVRHSGSGIGTVPMRATAVAMLVAIEMTIATTSHQMLALVNVSHSCCGLPTCERRAKTAIRVPIAIMRFVPLTR